MLKSVTYPSGNLIKVVIQNYGPSSMLWWNGTTTEIYNSANFASYLISTSASGPETYDYVVPNLPAGRYKALAFVASNPTVESDLANFVQDEYFYSNGFTITNGDPVNSSYNTLDSANAYFANRLFATAWTNANDTNKQAALTAAQQIIDRFNYVGVKTGLTTNPITPQTTEFPRSYIYFQNELVDPTTVPDDILSAECEIAIALLKGIDPEREAFSVRVKSRSIAGVRTTYDSNIIPEFLENGVPSSIAWQLIRPYFDTTQIKDIGVRRVS